MNKRLTLMVWIFVSLFWVATGHAAATEVAETDPQQADSAVSASQAATTPPAALTWQQRENAVHENQKRAAAMRQMEINRESILLDQQKGK